MPDKASKKKPEIPQPRPDVVLPDGNGAAGSGERDMQRAPSPRSDPGREEL